MGQTTGCSLVSDGCECILINKKFFLHHLSDDMAKKIRKTVSYLQNWYLMLIHLQEVIVAVTCIKHKNFSIGPNYKLISTVEKNAQLKLYFLFFKINICCGYSISKWQGHRGLLTVPRPCFFYGSFLLFMFRFNHAVLWVHCRLVITCWERAGLLALLCVVFSLCFITFPCGVRGQVSYLIVWIPDLCGFPYFLKQFIKWQKKPTLVVIGSF